MTRPPCKTKKLNLRHLLLALFSCAVSVYGATIKDNTGSSERSDSLVPKKNFQTLPEEVILYIGEFLECPQKRLGCQDRFLRQIFIEMYPYSQILARRHGIVELKTSKSDNDLGVFSLLAFVKEKDKKYLYECLHSLLFEKNAFSVNEGLVLRYLIRTEHELLLEDSIVSNPESQQDKIIEILKKRPDYDYMIEYFVKNELSFKRFCCDDLDMNIGKEFMARVMNINEALYLKIEKDLQVYDIQGKKILISFDQGQDLKTENEIPFNQERARRNVYNHLLNFDNVFYQHYKTFVIMSLFANVPENYYFHLIPYFYNVNARDLIRSILIFNELSGTDEDNLRIHNTMNRMNPILYLELNVSKAEVQSHKLVNKLRYGSVDWQSLLAEHDAFKLSSDYCYVAYQVAAVAALTRNIEALRQIRINSTLEHWHNFIVASLTDIFYKRERLGIKIFFALFEIYSEIELQELFNEMKSIKFILNCYDLDNFEYNEGTSRAIVKLILRPEFSETDFPLSFDFSFSRSSWNRKVEILTQLDDSFFDQHTVRDQDSVRRLFLCYKDFESRGFRSRYQAFSTSSSFLKTISVSKSLLEIVLQMKIKFQIVNRKLYVELLKTDISSLKGIISNYEGLLETLSHIKCDEQIRNLENLLELDIASILRQKIELYDNDNLKSESTYYKLRTVLRYWLKSPSKGRMVELKAKHSSFLRLLEREVDIEDAKFIQSL